MTVTSQTGIKKFNRDSITKNAFFLQGISSQNRQLQALDPQKTGYHRIFIVKNCEFASLALPNETKWFKWMLETLHTEISGIGDVTMNFSSIQGGLPGNSIEIPTLLIDDTNEITITVAEQSGSPIREYISYWLNGIADRQSGYGTYNGAFDGDNPYNLTYCQANHTMEAIYVSTDPTGKFIEYACLLTNMVPKSIKESVFNAQSGTVNITPYDIAFTCNKYVSTDINKRAAELLAKYNVTLNSLNLKSGYTSEDIKNMAEYDLNE